MIRLTDSQRAVFDAYMDRILTENKRAGLTSLTERDAIYDRHFVESLALLEALEGRGMLASPAIDIGSGAGFPGLPIAILRPNVEMTLLEATGKKAAFLQSVAGELGLANVRVVHARAEELGREPAHRGAYRLALARAVAPLRVLLELALPLLQTGGVLAAPKGSAASRELREAGAALAALSGEMEFAGSLPVEGAQPAPTLVIIRKTGETPERYPRRPGMPKKRPL